MNHSSNQDETAIRYLLGGLTEQERVVIEQDYFNDPDKFEAVLEAENFLVDCYVRGQLSDDEHKLFEQNFMRSPNHLERVAVAELLLEAVNQPRLERAWSQPLDIASWRWRNWREKLSGWRKVGIGLATTALLILIVAFAWLARERQALKQDLARAAAQITERRQREDDIARQLSTAREQNETLAAEVEQLRHDLELRPAEPVRVAERSRAVLSFLLSPLLVRGVGSGPQQIVIPRETETVQLQMKVGSEAPPNSLKFEAKIDSVEGKTLWSGKTIRAKAGSAVAGVEASHLPAGDYILTLSSVNQQGEREEINRYFFRVIRR